VHERREKVAGKGNERDSEREVRSQRLTGLSMHSVEDLDAIYDTSYDASAIAFEFRTIDQWRSHGPDWELLSRHSIIM